MIFEALVNQVLDEQNRATRITTGSGEIRDILRNKRLQSQEPAYKGYTFFSTKPEVDDSLRQYLPKPSYKDRFGAKLGYVFKANPNALEDVPKEIATGSPYPEYYSDRGYKVARPGTPSSSIQTVQRIKVAPELNQFKEKDIVLGKERDFNRFMQIYNKLLNAYERGKIRTQPPRLTPGAGIAGATALMQFLNTEVPPDMRNSMLAGGGYGIKGKFEATP